MVSGISTLTVSLRIQVNLVFDTILIKKITDLIYNGPGSKTLI